MKLGRREIVILVATLAVCVAALLSLIGRRAKADQASDAALRPVAVILAERQPISNSLTLSGEFRPFQEVDVHAKIAGYIRKISVDVGDHIEAGQTLAILEVPELNAQLLGAEASVRRAQDAIRRAHGDLDRAKSLHAATQLDYQRLKEASTARPGLIAEQELDDLQAKDKEGEAQVAADEAALSEARNQLDEALAQQKQVRAMSDYTRIVAPFKGVVTRRYVDTGALVQAGTNSNTQALPVVSVAETDLFRLTLPVPESAVPLIRLGNTVTVQVPSLKRNFEGKVSRYADAVNQETRTMHTEVDVPNVDLPNKDGSIVAGMYAEVNLALAKKDAALVVPIQAVARNGEHASVLVVNSQDRIEERNVQLGLEGSNEVEVVSGLSSSERVVVGSRSQFRVGDRVAPKVITEKEEGNF
jgi:RND family efflux transporter MFP subunit